MRQIYLNKQVILGVNDDVNSLFSYYKAKITPTKWNKGIGLKATSGILTEKIKQT